MHLAVTFFLLAANIGFFLTKDFLSCSRTGRIRTFLVTVKVKVKVKVKFTLITGHEGPEVE
jgi:hypothetical protein